MALILWKLSGKSKQTCTFIKYWVHSYVSCCRHLPDYCTLEKLEFSICNSGVRTSDGLATVLLIRDVYSAY